MCLDFVASHKSTLAKQTIDALFPSQQQIAEVDELETEVALAKKARTHGFQQEWLRELEWLRASKKTNTMNCIY